MQTCPNLKPTLGLGLGLERTISTLNGEEKIVVLLMGANAARVARDEIPGLFTDSVGRERDSAHLSPTDGAESEQSREHETGRGRQRNDWIVADPTTVGST